MAIVLTSCGPPTALRRFIDNMRSKGDIESFGAPAMPGTPSNLVFGTLLVTNSSSWGDLVAKGQDSGGALVLDVLPGSEADRLELVRGDVIVGIDEQDIHNQEEVIVAFKSSQVARHRILAVRVDGDTQSFDATLTGPEGIQTLEYLQTKPDPKDAVTQYLIAQQLQDPGAAVTKMRAMMADYINFAEGQALLAMRLSELVRDANQQKEAEKLIAAAAKADPESTEILRTRSAIDLSFDHPDLAASHASDALSIDAFSAESHWRLGSARIALGQPRDALVDLHRAVDINPFEVNYYITLAICFSRLQQQAKALATIEAAKSLVTTPDEKRALDEILTPSTEAV